jgi:hypothetical protein
MLSFLVNIFATKKVLGNISLAAVFAVVFGTI